MSNATALSVKDPYLDNQPKGNWINGRYVAAISGETFESVNPATGLPIATLARSGAEDVDSAVRAARAAFRGSWSRWTPAERQRLLERIREVLGENFQELARLDTLEMGAPLSRTMGMKASAQATISYYASQVYAGTGQTVPNSLPGSVMTMIVKAPVGVIGGIIPWNGPLSSVWWIIGPAIATGCTLVLKPAEDASLSLLRIGELLQQAGVPDGVVNVVTGYGSEAGSALSSHPDVDRIAFTGSTETGRNIIRASAVNIKRLQLELGGKSPDIVFADADLDAAVPGAAMAVYRNSGQVCYAGTRLFVERKVYSEFVERLKVFTETLKVGNGLDPDVQLGPLVSRKQLDRVLSYIDIGGQEGAILAAGGCRIGGELANGYFIEPTVFSNVTNDMRIAREEIFGPVISVIPFETPEEALALANDTEYGLGGAVWTRDVAKALRMVNGIQAGTIWVNGYGQVDAAIGFGGIKMSGYGTKGGPAHVDSYLYHKSVYING
ncbi:aldehyde dehydrogenase family protein [Sinorhizobium medicae]|uniref:aldehyde dehydrogenase family protein n=1 Tax=Sinorhizobium medicae TaxID=110321 RepID=UPI000FD9D876|nr:aldehyde dehydrogenase family protein [Sinorhizobium medicae]RVO73525.1 aldehyde dehydrogenase [Sinorhizobium medicae]